MRKSSNVTDNPAIQLAYDHITEKLGAQQQYVVALRGQAGISSAVTGLIGTVFGTFLNGRSEIFHGDAFFGFAVTPALALLLMAASIACSAMVVVHTYDFTFSFDAVKMINRSRSAPSFDAHLENYVNDGEWFFRDNERMIGHAQSLLWFAMIFGFAQILPWMIMLGAES